MIADGRGRTAHCPSTSCSSSPGKEPSLAALDRRLLGGSALGVVNGVARDLLYKDRVGDLTAHQISTGTLIALLALYFWILEGRWPIPSLRSAFAIGGTWLVLTVLFEFSFGHYVDGKSWSELLENYNIADGHVWILGPAGMRELRMMRGA